MTENTNPTAGPGPLYPKINGPYRRHTEPGPLRNKLIEGEWTSPELEATAGLPWIWTEKIDGSSGRVIWDGFRVEFRGRTDNAQWYPGVLEMLTETFPEEIFEQVFGETPAILFGEFTSPKIQKVGRFYGPEPKFTLFDVLVGNVWLLRSNVEEVAESLGISIVPVIHRGTVLEAIELVRAGVDSRTSVEPFTAEGLVGVTEAGLLDRRGRRLIVKVKSCDFLES